jgi:hypothetical protein
LNIRDWLVELQHLLNELENIDFGHALDENWIKPPASDNSAEIESAVATIANNKQLEAFYRECNGISMPDVWNGYFIHELEHLKNREAKGEPTSIEGKLQRDIAVFGSDGGGGMFAIRLAESDILYLPNGEIRNSVYLDTANSATRLANDFEGFLARLLADVDAFVHDTPDHVFMAS